MDVNIKKNLTTASCISTQ
uniref:Uncharacterized protein n=1 Tax=Anguilla anguilla TaxID=7936 RepID=A0A0E9W227_ANGAN